MIAVARGRHVIFGTGPVGSALARALQESGRTVVAIPVNEYGSDPFDTPIARGNPTDFDMVLRLCEGAEAIYLCLNGPADEWADQFPPIVDNIIEVASLVGARLVYWDLAHMYGSTREPIVESTPNLTKSGPARVLIDLADRIIDATWTGRIDGVVGRSADIYGPGAIGPEFGSSFGSRIFWPALEDRELTVVGDVESPRSMAFVDDVARGLITLGEMHESAGHIWHLPCADPVSPVELASQVVSQARSSADIGATPRHLRGCALLQLKIVRADISEVQHELHSLDRPFVLDHSKYTQAFGQSVTEHSEAIRKTLQWYRAHPRPYSEPILERVIDRLPQVAQRTRIARRLASGAWAMARTTLTPVN